MFTPDRHAPRRLGPLAAAFITAATALAVAAPSVHAQSLGSFSGDPTPPVVVDPGPIVTPPDNGPTLAVFIGDSFTSPAKVGSPVDNWAEIVAERFCWEPTYLATGGSGYITIPERVKFTERIPAATAVGADVIVVQGSTNDYRHLDTILAEGVSETLEAIVAANPQAQVVVLGPTRPVVSSAPGVDRMRALMSRASADLGLPFVDGSDPTWLGHPDHYIDNQHLTPLGHTEFGRLVGDEFAAIPVESGC